MIKAIILGVVSSTCIGCILLCIMAVIFTASSLLPYEYLSYIVLIVDAISAFFGGYISSRINKSKGLILGLINGFILFMSIAIGGLIISNDTVSIVTLLKAISIIICSTIGGIKGVNVKEKIHIK